MGVIRNLNKVENALKLLYLNHLREELNTHTNPLINKIEHTSNYVFGKDIRVKISDEIEFRSTVKNMYGIIQISDKMIRTWGNDLSHFNNLFNGPMENFLTSTKVTISRMLYDFANDQEELTGIRAIFDMDKPLYGVERNVSPIMNPLIKEENKFSIESVGEVIDELTDRGSNVDFIGVSADVKYAFQNDMVQSNRQIDVIQLDGGFKSLSYNGIPIVYDKFIQKGTMYLLSTREFKFHQLCDWNWLENDKGHILRMAYLDGSYYNAILVKYGDLICNRPDRQGMIKFKEK